MRWAYLLVGLGELFFLGALSIIGERENTQIHVIMFYIFGFCGIGFFIASTYCHRQTLYYTKPYGKLSYRLKIIFMTCYLICLPVLVTSFLLYWRLCLTFSEFHKPYIESVRCSFQVTTFLLFVNILEFCSTSDSMAQHSLMSKTN